jgi:outer membrane beta-barrel protein
MSRPWIHRLAIPLSLAVAFAAASARAQDDDDDDEAPTAHAPVTPAPAKPEAKPAPAAAPAPAKAEPAPPSAPAAKTNEEGEEGEGPAHPANPASSSEGESAPAKATAAPVQPGYMEGRAESTSPNELIHTVEKKTYTAAGQFEVTLYPAAIQLNSKFTNTDGVALAVSYALQENISLQLMGFYNYVAGETPFTQELLLLHARPEAADALSLDYGAVGAFEVSPIYGKFAFYQGALAQFRFVLNAGAGFGHTNVQLTPGADAADPTATAQYGDAGLRFLGNLGVGFRILIGSSVAIRLEVRDLLYTARVDHINGCTLNDVTDLLANGTSPESGCNLSSFNPNSSTALTVAKDLLGDVSSDVVNDVIFFGGASILF